MSETYAKLFESILDSSVWSEPHATRIVWVTMMAMSDQHGIVDTSVPGLARRAVVSIQECETALATFLAPDRYSRTPDLEGRRIEAVPGGWRLLNHATYRSKRDPDSTRERKAKWIADKREKMKAVDAVDVRQASTKSTSVDMSTVSTHTDTDTDTKKRQEPEQKPRARESTPAALACIAMRQAGCVRVNPSDPNLLAALAEGVEPQTLADCATEAIEAGKSNPFSYAIAVARSRNAEGAKPVGASNANRTHGGSRRNLSAVERVAEAIADRDRREQFADREPIDGTCELVDA